LIERIYPKIFNYNLFYLYLSKGILKYLKENDDWMKLKCDQCGAEFEHDGLPEEDMECPECGASDGSFEIVG
jgi:rubrerythrin